MLEEGRPPTPFLQLCVADFLQTHHSLIVKIQPIHLFLVSTSPALLLALLMDTNDLATSVRESIILLVADCCSQHLFDDFDDFSGVVSSIEREDEVLEENNVSEGRVEYTQSENALSAISVDRRCRYRRYGFPLV